MIFLTVGTQLPFDRLIAPVDAWAEANGGEAVVAQIGNGQYKPRHMKAYPFLPPDRFEHYQSQSALLISHAGMGAILGALESGKPLIVMPRLASAGEHRNDHQMATANHFRGAPGIYVARDVDELGSLLQNHKELRAGIQISSNASRELVDSLRHYLLHDARAPVTSGEVTPGGAPLVPPIGGHPPPAFASSSHDAQKG
jgi:UDP-N-acetylglucosamine transferase subunit ALG13